MVLALGILIGAALGWLIESIIDRRFWKPKIDCYEQELDVLRAETDDLRIRTADAENSFTRLNARIHELQTENGNLSAEASTLTKTTADLRRNRDQLQFQLADAQTRIERGVTGALTDTSNSHLRAELSSATEELAKLRDERKTIYDTVRQRFTDLQDELEIAKTNLDQESHRNKLLNEELAALQAQLSKTVRQVDHDGNTKHERDQLKKMLQQTTEHNNELQERLDMTLVEIEDYRVALETALHGGEVSDTEHRMQQIVSERNKLQVRFNKLSADYSTLRQQMVERDNAIERLQSTLNGVNIKLHNRNAEVETLRAQNTEFDVALTDTALAVTPSQDVVNLENNLTATTTKLAAKIEEVNALRTDLDAKTTALAAAQQDQLDLVRVREELRNTKQALENAQLADAAVASWKLKVQDLQGHLTGSEERVQRLEQDLANHKLQLQSKADLAASLETRINALQVRDNANTELQAQVALLKGRFADVETQLSASKDDTASYKQRYDEAVEQLELAKHDLIKAHGWRDQLRDVNEALAQRNLETDALRREVFDLTKKIETHEDQLSQTAVLRSDLVNARTDLRDREVEVNSLQLQLETTLAKAQTSDLKEQEVEDLRGKLRVAHNDLGNAGKLVETLRRRLTLVTAELESEAEKEARLLAQLELMQREQAELKARLQSVDGNDDVLELQLSAAQAEIDSLRAQIKLNSTADEQLQSDLEAARQEVERYREMSSGSTKKLATLTGQLNAAKNTIAQLRTALTSVPEIQTTTNFTKISGIGEEYESRLQRAGIYTYADLATVSASKIREVIGVDVDAESWQLQARQLLTQPLSKDV